MKQAKTQRLITRHLAPASMILAATGLCLSTAASAPSAATTQAATHTERFTSETLDTVQLAKNKGFVEFSKDTANGKIIGADSLTGTYHATTGTVSGEVTFLREGGLMTGRFTLNTNTLEVVGTITGGSGKYHGVSGTITGQAAGRTKTLVTLSYTR